MATEQQIFEAEHEIRRWHAERARRPKFPGAMASAPRRLSWYTAFVRWLHAGATDADQTRGSAQPATVPTLTVLRAVARGEISPEAAQQLLATRP